MQYPGALPFVENIMGHGLVGAGEGDQGGHVRHVPCDNIHLSQL